MTRETFLAKFKGTGTLGVGCFKLDIPHFKSFKLLVIGWTPVYFFCSDTIHEMDPNSSLPVYIFFQRLISVILSGHLRLIDS